VLPCTSQKWYKQNTLSVVSAIGRSPAIPQSEFMKAFFLQPAVLGSDISEDFDVPACDHNHCVSTRCPLRTHAFESAVRLSRRA
jgi:hypothetical protein